MGFFRGEGRGPFRGMLEVWTRSEAPTTADPAFLEATF